MSIPITYLPSSPDYSDYRPVYSPCGTQVLYERAAVSGSQPTQLWIYELGCAEPVLFVQNPPADLNQTRADWSRAKDQTIALAGYVGTGNKSIWLVNSDGAGLQQVPGTTNMTYPSWYPCGDYLAVMNTGIPPGPLTVKIDPSGTVLENLTDPQVVYSGMPSVCQTGGGQRIAFPGQKNEGQPYNENNNNVWISDQPGEACPLDQQQGRTPWWSPDGKWIAFESNRSGQGYAIYVAAPDGCRIIQLTDPALEGQHPKWSPDGKSIVFVAKQIAGAHSPNRIGILCVEGILEG